MFESLICFFIFRYLATGRSHQDLADSYRIGRSTVQTIIPEVCDAIFKVLQPIYLKSKTTQDWLTISEDFLQTWNFPHCVGAIDGKHIAIQSPRKSGSSYWNYKGFYSVVLLGVADASYKFSYVDIGASGIHSDGGIFGNSILGKRLQSNEMNFPQPSILGKTFLN